MRVKPLRLVLSLLLIASAIAIVVIVLLARNSRYSHYSIFSLENFYDALPTLALMLVAATFAVVVLRKRDS